MLWHRIGKGEESFIPMKRLIPRAVGLAIVIALVFTVVLIGTVAAKVVSSLATQQAMITNLHMSNSCDGSDIAVSYTHLTLPTILRV